MGGKPFPLVGDIILEIALAIGYQEPIRWLSTEIAIDHEVAGDWDEAREMVDELIPGYAQSPFWIEPRPGSAEHACSSPAATSRPPLSMPNARSS